MRKLLLCCVLAIVFCFALAAADELEMGVGQPNVYADAKEAGVQYLSSEPSIATVNAANGYISALKPGSCVITAQKEGKTVYSLNLKVLKAPTKLSVPEKSIEMMQGSYRDFLPCHAQPGEFEGGFEIRSNGSAVSVSGGQLYARDVGSATIYVRAYNGVYVSYEVKVRVKPTQITLTEHSVRLGIGEELILNAEMQPAFCYSRLNWTVTGTDVITFDEQGLRVKAVANGEATITVATENGLKDSMRISVLPLPEELLTPETVFTGEGDSGMISSVIPEGTFADCSYESLTPDTLQIGRDGRWTALKSGEAVVRIHAEGTQLYALQRFEIAPLPASVKVSCTANPMYVGQKASCKATILPEGSYGKVTWTSSNPRCVGVDEDGTLTAYTYGSSVITATAVNGVKANVTVSVLKNPQSINISQSYLALDVGRTAVLSCVFPRDTLAELTYVSLDETIAAVDAQTGLVTAMAPGSTVIIATTSNGVSANCFVTVPYEELPAEAELEVLFMDVDSNDAILLRSGEEYAFIDSGNHIYGEKVTDFLKESGMTRLKYYIGSHAHIDHIGGACVILDNFEVDSVIVPHRAVIQAIKGSVWTESERKATQNAVYSVITHGQVFYLGTVQFRCIGPVNVRNVDTKDKAENANSMVLRADVGEVSLLLTGDGTIAEFNDILKLYRAQMHVDVFKNTHHSGELTDEQIAAISPKITVFSTSSLHIPQDRYVKLLTSLGSEIYMTPTRVNGNITLYTDGKTITVTPQYEDNRANWYNEITGKPRT